MIHATVLGRLCADPEDKTSASGIRYTSIRLACDTTRRKEEGKGYVANFINATVFGKQGEVVMQYCHKGDQIIANGDLEMREYVGKDGQNHTSLEMGRASVTLLWGKREETSSAPTYTTPAPSPAPRMQAEPVSNDDDLPF